MSSESHDNNGEVRPGEDDKEGEQQPTPSARARSREEVADYLLEIGATLAACGCPSYRLEDVMRLIADIEGHRADPFALPTGLFLRVSSKDGAPPGSGSVQRMTRVNDWGVDLARLTLVDEIFNDVVDRRATIEQARVRIRECMQRPPEWSPAIVFAATVVVSGAAAVFFQGGPLDILVAGLVGAVIAGGRLALTGGPSTSDADLKRKSARGLLSDFLGGLFAASCAWLALRIWPEARPEVIVPAGAIALFPGMTFTTGVAEVAQKNVVAGGARLIESAVTLLLILFGVALIAGLGGVMGVELPNWLGKKSAVAAASSSASGVGLPWQGVALLASSFAFGALFQVPRRWLWTTLLSSATGWIVATVAVWYRVPGHVAAFCAALAVCVLANGLARATNRPAQLFQLPGMMLLVPGSFGFLSLGDFLEQNVIDGTQRGFTMALVGAALVIGVLVANVVVPSRKLL